MIPTGRPRLSGSTDTFRESLLANEALAEGAALEAVLSLGEPDEGGGENDESENDELENDQLKKGGTENDELVADAA